MLPRRNSCGLLPLFPLNSPIEQYLSGNRIGERIPYWNSGIIRYGWNRRPLYPILMPACIAIDRMECHRMKQRFGYRGHGTEGNEGMHGFIPISWNKHLYMHLLVTYQGLLPLFPLDSLRGQGSAIVPA